MAALPEVPTAHLFADLHRELIAVLRALSVDDWGRMATPRWTVRDVAAHLLDGDVRRLSAGRDGVGLRPPPIDGYGDLVEWLNQLNAEWVDAARRMSPAVLITLLEATGPQVAAFLGGLDPHAPALYPVGWAGEDESRNWMDVGREYTERWHHQQQIRDAVGRTGLTEARWMGPVLSLSLRALPVAYAPVDAPAGTAIRLDIAGDGGGSWHLLRGGDGWSLQEGTADGAACHLRMDADTAWRVLLHNLPADAARPRIGIEGDPSLAEPFLNARAVMV